jgi:hypothetical protein
MVPVPEDLTAAVERFLAWGVGRPEPEPWDEASVATVLDGLDAASTGLLELVAETSLRESPLSIVELEAELRRHRREILGSVLEINHNAPPGPGRAYLLQLRPIDALTHEAPGIHDQLVFMEDQVARLVRTRLRQRT